MSDVQIVVSVDNEHTAQLPKVVQHLKAAGMNVESLMDKIGVIVGSCDSEKVGLLSCIEGVAHVEEEKEFKIPELDMPS